MKLTEQRLINMTRDLVYRFYEHLPNAYTEVLADGFMWIGAFDFQWSQDLKQFRRIAANGIAMTPVLVSSEEYHVLTHEKSLWVVYGRHIASILQQNGLIMQVNVRGTYIWKEFSGQLKLLHVHGSNAQTAPSTLQTKTDLPLSSYMQQADRKHFAQNERLSFRDRQGKNHFLHPIELFYIKAHGPYGMFFTPDPPFLVRSTLLNLQTQLPGSFVRIHKSYLANIAHIETISRYQVHMRNGDDLPISKDRYMSIKQLVQLTS